jgi:hypothetical protein
MHLEAAVTEGTLLEIREGAPQAWVRQRIVRQSVGPDHTTGVHHQDLAPMAGEHDLCLIFTAPAKDPLYVIDGMKLVRRL